APAGEVLSRERLIHYRHPRGVGDFPREELATGEKWRSDGLEVAVADVDDLCRRRVLSCSRYVAGWKKAIAFTRPAERNVLGRAGTQHTGNSAHLVDYVAVELLIVLMARRAHSEVHDQQPLRSK